MDNRQVARALLRLAESLTSPEKVNKELDSVERKLRDSSRWLSDAHYQLQDTVGDLEYDNDRNPTPLSKQLDIARKDLIAADRDVKKALERIQRAR